MKKRLVAVTMAAVMAAGTFGVTVPVYAKDDSSFTIGARFPVTIDQMQQQTMDNITQLVEAAGGELLVENAALTPEGNIQAYERLIAAGVDGLVVIPAADSVLPRIKEMCEDAEIPWSVYYRSILDEDIKKEVESSEYYLGNTYEDEIMAGYNLTAKMGEAGCKNIVLFSTALGDTTGAQREEGMNQACEEYGIEVINEFRATAQASDAAQSIESVLTTHPEVDGIFIAAGTITPGILPAITSVLDQYGRDDVKITIIDYPQGLQDAFADGYMLAACGGHNVTDPLFATSLVLNKIKGTPLSEEAFSVRINQMILESEEDVVNYFKYCESGVPTYTPDEAKEMLFKWENDEVTQESFLKVAEEYTIDSVIERHKGLVD
ncbi:substrate-binding domain-containing protein [Blautia schinkii]|nr:substrate-binding domain-containing protein [Blautia schinkii]